MSTHGYHAPAPPWALTVYKVLGNAKQANCRINHFRLTQQEAWELKVYTGRDDILLGYPVEIKREAA
jgi:hypothetical protein